MADGGMVSFDLPFSLTHELEGNPKGPGKQFVDYGQLEREMLSTDFTRPKQKQPELFPQVAPLTERLPSDPGEFKTDSFLYAKPKDVISRPPVISKPILPPPEPEPMTVVKAPKVEVKPLVSLPKPEPLEETKPAHTWQVAKPTQMERPEDKPVIGQHRVEAPVMKSQVPQMFQGTVNMLGSVWARIVDDIYETRAAGHVRTNETLKTHVKKRNHINSEFFEHIDKVHENSKKEDTWSFIFNVTEFLLISTGIVGGMGLIASGASTGNMSLVYYGGEMLLGSACSMGSFALKHMNYDSTYVGALGLSGAILTGAGIKQGFAVLANKDLAATLAAINEGAMGLSRSFMSYVQLGSQKIQSKLQKENNELNIDRTKNQDDIQKTVGSFKMEDLIELSKAASEQIRMKGDVISRIILGSRS